jgi:hypothetical protein
MNKQKNDIGIAQRKRAKRIKITVALLAIVMFGVAAGFSSAMGNKVYRLQNMIFPYTGVVHKRICAPHDDDGSYILSDSLSIKPLNAAFYHVELSVDGVKIPDDQIEQRPMGAVGNLTAWCYSQGLDLGVYEMEMKIKDLQDNVLGAYQWTITILTLEQFKQR